MMNAILVRHGRGNGSLGVRYFDVCRRVLSSRFCTACAIRSSPLLDITGARKNSPGYGRLKNAVLAQAALSPCWPCLPLPCLPEADYKAVCGRRRNGNPANFSWRAAAFQPYLYYTVVFLRNAKLYAGDRKAAARLYHFSGNRVGLPCGSDRRAVAAGA